MTEPPLFVSAASQDREMTHRILAYDWDATPLGPIGDWVLRCRHAVEMMLSSAVATFLVKGPERLLLYNDAARGLVGDDHPSALGRPAASLPGGWRLSRDLLDRGFRGETVTLRRCAWAVRHLGEVGEKVIDLYAIPVSFDDRTIHAVQLQIFDLTDIVRTHSALKASEGLLRQFGDATPDILWIRDAETLQWQYLTPAFEPIYGISREEALSGNNLKRWIEFVLPEDRDQVLGGIRRVRAGETVSFDYRIRRPADGRLHWMRDTDFPIHDAAGRVSRIGGIGQDITALKATEAALADSRREMGVLLDGMPQLVWRSLDGGNWTWASAQWCEFTGQTAEQSRVMGWMDVIHPDDHPVTERAWREARPHGMLDVEHRVRRAADGAWLWHHTRSLPVHDEAGRIVEWLGTSTDIQELKELQDRQAVMVAELQHRTRNLIAVVGSVAEQTRATTPTSDAFQAAFQDRLAALSRIQGLLSRAEESPITILALIELELDALGGAEGMRERIVVEGPPVTIRSSVVQTFSLALHELTTNALKYGALAGPHGRLHIAWYVQNPDTRGARLVLEWLETGIPARPPGSAPYTAGGYGRELIERALPYSLGARTRLEIDDHGVRCLIDMPLERRERRRAAP